MKCSVYILNLWGFFFLLMFILSPSHASGLGFQNTGDSRILEWVAMPSSKGSSWPRDQTCDPLEKGMATHSSILSWKIPMDRGAWWAIVHGVTKSWIQLSNKHYATFQFSSVQSSCSVMSDSLWPHGLQHARPSCPSPTPRVYSNSCPLSWWCHPTISSFVVPFSSLLLSFPVSGSFPMSQFFASGGLSIGVSASTSVFPVNIQDWFPLGWTGWFSLQSKGDSRVFSNTTVQHHQFFGTQLSL